MIKQSLQLRIGQQLSMTPQLQQAIRLLQLSTLDLQQEIQSALESNPMLEVVDEESDVDDTAEVAHARDDARDRGASADRDSEWTERLPEELPVDAEWDDWYDTAPTERVNGGESADRLDLPRAAQESLSDHLLWQLNLTPMPDRDRVIATMLIDAIGPDGFLTLSVEEIHEALQPELAELDRDEVLAVLHLIQQFDPPGVGARDLQECLMIQLRQCPADTPWREQALRIVRDHLTLLGNQDIPALLKRARLSEEALNGALTLIRRLSPRPGDAIPEDNTEYVVPDVFVRKAQDRWVVELNPDIAPRLRINRDYAALVRRADNSEDNTYLRNNLQEARWFLKSLVSRNETLLRVATRIVEHQRGFLEHGEEAMQPLILHDIASALDLHESTVSRATTRKYMHTPRGVYELKYFFSSHVGTADSGEYSSTAIRAKIRHLIAGENPRKPLSDNKIAEQLAGEGIQVARRTVAKYRESLSIPSSSERKRLL